MRVRPIRSLAAAAAVALSAAPCIGGELSFDDVTAEAGLAGPLALWRVSHGAAWGDVDGDGRPDLYLGAFADRPLYDSPDPPIPNPLFLNRPDGFVLSEETAVRFEGRHARTTMALFADLDNDGDLDLVAGNNPQHKLSPGSALFENVGNGRFRDATPDPPPWPAGWSVRNVSALDINRDGLLDLVLTDGLYAHMRSGNGRLLVLENRGGWEFVEAGAAYGFPVARTAGLGMAVGDINNDGRFDIFVANDNRLFVSTVEGKYRSASLDVFPKAHREFLPCGAVFGDLNGDDLLDMVLTVHDTPGEYHAYLNRGIRDGVPALEKFLEGRFPPEGAASGLPVKAGQVSLTDMDNDGLRDIVITVTYLDDRDRLQPFVLRNLGTRGTEPAFDVPPHGRATSYYCPAPLADYDRDGRVDMFLAAWFDDQPNILFRNTTRGGHWLRVRVNGDGNTLNTMGIGSIVRIYEAGHAGEMDRLLGRHDMSIGNGYSSGEEAVAHFGLGRLDACDVVVEWRDMRTVRRGVPADQLLNIAFPSTQPVRTGEASTQQE